MTTRKTNTHNNTHTGRKSEHMTKNTDLTLDQIIDEIAERVAAKIGQADLTAEKPAAKSTKSGKSKAAEPEDEDEDDEDEDEGDIETRKAELTGMRITSLKKIAKELGFDPDDVAGASKEELIDSILSDEFGDEADDDEDADEDEDEADETDEEDEDDEDEDGEYDRDDLEAMSLKEVKEVAKESGIKVADMKGLDQDEIIDLILGESDDEDVDDEDEEEDEEEGDEDYWDEDELKAMSLAELKDLCKEYDIAIPKPANKKTLIAALMAE